MRIMDTRPTKKMTIMKLLKMLNQWIWNGQKEMIEEGQNHRDQLLLKRTYSMLKKVWIEVLVESVLKLDWRALPAHFVGEGNDGPMLKFHLVLRGKVHIHNLFPIVADFKLLVGEDVVVIVLPNLPHDPPNGEIIKVHLVPVMILHSIKEGFQFLITEFHLTVRGV